LQMNEIHILIRLLRMYIPRNWEFGSGLSKRRNFGGGGIEPPNPFRYATHSSWNPNSSTLEPYQLQLGRTSACVIAQQYSSSTFVSLRFHFRKEILARILKMLLFYFLITVCLKLYNQKVRKSGSVWFELKSASVWSELKLGSVWPELKNRLV
jgi:hypothetical protein